MFSATPTPLLDQAAQGLEGVMNFSPYAIASGHGFKKTIPQRRFRRRVDVRGPIPRARPRGRPSTPLRSARGPQRAEVCRTHRLCVEIHAPRPSAVGSRLPTNAAMAQGGSVRADDPRFARTVAVFEGEGARAECGHTRLSHAALHARERLSGRLRWTQEQEGLEGARGGGHFGTPAHPARKPGQRGRPKGGREALRGDTKSDRGESRVGLRRSGIHGPEGIRVCRRARHPARSGQARRSQGRLRTLTKEMGGRARFCVGIALSTIGEGLREAARDFGGASRRCVCLPLSPAGSGHPPHKFITPSKEAFEEVKRTEAGDQLCELDEGPYLHEKARYWQANLLFERVSEQAGHPWHPWPESAVGGPSPSGKGLCTRVRVEGLFPEVRPRSSSHKADV